MSSTTQPPYAHTSPAISPVDYELHPDPAERRIKKKHKHGDTRQLELDVFNVTCGKAIDRHGGRATNIYYLPYIQCGPRFLLTLPVSGYRAS